MAIKKVLVTLLLIFTAGFIYLYSTSFKPLIHFLADKEIRKIGGSMQADSSEFKILFCGTGSPNRTPDRGQPCTAIVADGKLFVFDAGEGAFAKLKEYGAPVGRLEKVFVTHLHSDHISGIAEVLHNTWLYGRRHEVEVIGPTGVKKMVAGFADAYEDDLTERTRVVGAENIDPNLAFIPGRDVEVEPDELVAVYNKNGLTVGAFLVDHPDWHAAFGYLIEYKGKKVVISGDTAASDGIRKYAKGVDILIHEAVNMDLMTHIGVVMDKIGGPIPGKRMARIAAAHTPTLELAEIAEQAQAKHLIMTHLIPALPANWPADTYFEAGMDDIYKGNLKIARDGDWVNVLTY